MRDYSEYSGLPAALIEAGVCELIEVLHVVPFSSRVHVCAQAGECTNAETPGRRRLGVSAVMAQERESA